MTSSSSTGGYLVPHPSSQSQFPKNLNLIQFVQTILVGISELDGTLVRPKWQTAPPKQPDINTNWLSFGIANVKPDSNAYVGFDQVNQTILLRHETFEVQCSFYGPDSQEISSMVRDGFQITQNLESLTLAKLGFVDVSDALHIPDLVNERFINKFEMTIVLRREVQRNYPILSFVSASGKVHTVLGNEQYLMNWKS